VLLHGFGLHGGVFEPIVPELARHHRVLVVDLPGHGLSTAVAPWTLEAIASVVDSALAIEGPLVVLGWSFGALVALTWAQRRPERVSRLVLVSTSPSFVARDNWPHAMPASRLGQFGDELRASYRLTLKRFLTLQVQGSEEGRATLSMLRARLFERGEPSPAALAATLELLVDSDLRALLPSIRTPALVIGGERDTLAYPQAGEALAASLPDARFVTISGAAHAPFLSHREPFLAAVTPFLHGE
jgi:pimeloyl-[acyl-carrier protein] methyl ester esterase